METLTSSLPVLKSVGRFSVQTDPGHLDGWQVRSLQETPPSSAMVAGLATRAKILKQAGHIEAEPSTAHLPELHLAPPCASKDLPTAVVSKSEELVHHHLTPQATPDLTPATGRTQLAPGAAAPADGTAASPPKVSGLAALFGGGSITKAGAPPAGSGAAKSDGTIEGNMPAAAATGAGSAAAASLATAGSVRAGGGAGAGGTLMGAATMGCRPLDDDTQAALEVTRSRYKKHSTAELGAGGEGAATTGAVGAASGGAGPKACDGHVWAGLASVGCLGSIGISEGRMGQRLAPSTSAPTLPHGRLASGPARMHSTARPRSTAEVRLDALPRSWKLPSYSGGLGASSGVNLGATAGGSATGLAFPFDSTRSGSAAAVPRLGIARCALDSRSTAAATAVSRAPTRAEGIARRGHGLHELPKEYREPVTFEASILRAMKEVDLSGCGVSLARRQEAAFLGGDPTWR